MRIVDGLPAAGSILLTRLPGSLPQAPPHVQQRLKELFGGDITPEAAVSRIISDVRSSGDEAVLDYTRRIDGAGLEQLEVDRNEVAAAYKMVNRELLDALELAAGRIRSFHARQKSLLGMEFEEGGLGLLARPLDRVGIYVPGGRACYPSTVLMTAIPARVAGVSEVIVTTPPAPDGSLPAATLAAAHIAGVDRVFKAGGAQGIAALAYGTQSVPRVDKIVGPGNIFVTLAKRQVFGVVDIDGLHGPTETIVLADDSANPVLCAADLLAQAEHDEAATAIMVTTSGPLASAVNAEIERQLATLERQAIIRQSLDQRGAIVVVANIDQAIELANAYAPEHLCLMVKDASSYVDRIRHSGGIFVGTGEAIGDYVAGPSHVMPTGGSARFSSVLSVLDFLKVTCLVNMNDGTLGRVGPAAVTIARAEGLTAHARAIELRLQGQKETAGGG